MECCSNCGGSNLLEDFGRGDVLCGDCGLVTCTIMCHAPAYNETHDAGGVRKTGLPPPARRGQAFHGIYKGPVSTPYKRSTYFNEKLAQYRQLEPEIPEKDQDAIYRVYREHCRAWFNLCHVYGVPNKEHIRRVLGHIDEQRAAAGKKTRFVRVYLERWRSIRYMLSGVKSSGCFIPEECIHDMRRMFIKIEWAFNTIAAERAISRASFINYDFVMRRMLELLDMAYAADDLHPLKTPAKQGRLILWWLAICQKLQWPYINSDTTMFPSVPFYAPTSQELK